MQLTTIREFLKLFYNSKLKSIIGNNNDLNHYSVIEITTNKGIIELTYVDNYGIKLDLTKY